MRIKTARAAPTMIGIKRLVSSIEHSWAAGREKNTIRLRFYITTRTKHFIITNNLIKMGYLCSHMIEAFN